MKRPAIFLDRDGTLIEEVNYLSRVEDLRVFPFTGAALKTLKGAGFLLVVVTNQSGIGRGIYDEAAMHAIHDAMQAELEGAIDAFYHCPHLPCDGCSCRKPMTGMIDSAVSEHSIDREHSWMIGDKRVDVEVAQAAGVKSVLVLTGYGSSHLSTLTRPADIVANDVLHAAKTLIN